MDQSAQNPYLHLVRSGHGAGTSGSPLKATIHGQALFSMLDHSLRRNVGQERVIGTLLGTRAEDGSEIEIRNCFAVPHNESFEQVEVDMEYHKNMLSLYYKANPREVLIGWYATSSELNTFSALIQNFYASPPDGTYPHPAVHLAISTKPGMQFQCQTYISSAVGVAPERVADSCLFLPIPYEIKYVEAERSACKNEETRAARIFSDIDGLRATIQQTLAMVQRVSKYVDGILDKNEPGDTQTGRFLLNTLSLMPTVVASDVEKMFNSHLLDVLLVVYLANTVRTQIDLNAKLAPTT